MSLTLPQYFTNNVNLPGLTEAGEDNLQSAIDLYEPEVLKDILGDPLYELYVADDFASQRFIDLRDGGNFTFVYCGNTITRKYIGLGAQKSLLVHYIYYKYRSDVYTQTTRVGEAKTNTENSVIVSPREKLVAAWNRYVELTGLIPDKIREFDGTVINCNCFNKYNLDGYEVYNDKASLYNYMLANNDNYPEWEYEPKNKQKINVYDF